MSSYKSQVSGIDALLPLTKDKNDLFYTMSKTMNEAVRQNIKMLFYTSPGERIMIPEYGVGLRNFLFEQAPEIDIINRINEQVDFFLPEINILSLNVFRMSDRDALKTGQANSLNIELVYQIRGTNLRDSITFVDSEPS